MAPAWSAPPSDSTASSILSVAQNTPLLSVGEPIRFYHRQAPQTEIVSVYGGIQGDSLLYRRPAELATRRIALANVTGLEHSVGEHTHFWRGGLIGALSGGALGALAGATSDDGATSYGPSLSAGTAALAGVVEGFLVGGLIGGLHHGTTWSPAAMETRDENR